MHQNSFFTEHLFLYFYFFFCLGFPSQPFTNHRTAGEGGGHYFNSSLPLPSASHTLRCQLGDYCRELTSVHRQQSDPNREPLVSEPKSLTTKLRARTSTGNFKNMRENCSILELHLLNSQYYIICSAVFWNFCNKKRVIWEHLIAIKTSKSYEICVKAFLSSWQYI